MENKNQKRRSLLHDERGAAMVEAAILLPIFILIFGGVMYTSRSFETAVKQQAQARHCAWAYAKNACDGDQPAGCTFTEGSDMDSSVVAGNQDVQAADDENNFFTKIVDLIAGKSTTAAAQSTVTAPNVFGGGQNTIERKNALSCNEKIRHTFGQALEAAWDSFANF
ncbi:MAG: pilus assembly protein [Sandaracinaceae bacterium]|nr:pilus assembly protein [Sandaracinaceae bacterium]